MAEEEAESWLDKTMAKIEAFRRWVIAAQECMIAEDVHGGLAARTRGIIRKHPHAHTVLDEGAVMEVTHGLL